jgi:hypothetical protein
MKRFQFLLLDAGPIIKLFQLGIWDRFIERCEVTITSAVAAEAKWASQGYADIRIDFETYRDRVNIVEQEAAIANTFYIKLPTAYKDDVDVQDGEVQTLAFLCGSSGDWFLCSADHAVFRILGLLGKGEQGISLEEALKQIGLQPNICWEKITYRDEDWKYTRKFREQWTRKGQTDCIQGEELV